jgi:hypothetical protein
MSTLNPRSYESIRRAVREKRARGRGDLLRMVADEFFAPRIARREACATQRVARARPVKGQTITGGKENDSV